MSLTPKDQYERIVDIYESTQSAVEQAYEIHSAESDTWREQTKGMDDDDPNAPERPLVGPTVDRLRAIAFGQLMQIACETYKPLELVAVMARCVKDGPSNSPDKTSFHTMTEALTRDLMQRYLQEQADALGRAA